MCVICNMGRDEEAVTAASEFLQAWDNAHVAMRGATKAMLKVSQIAPDATDRARYDRMHKAMLRVMREWNRLEQIREAPPSEGGAG